MKNKRYLTALLFTVLFVAGISCFYAAVSSDVLAADNNSTTDAAVGEIGDADSDPNLGLARDSYLIIPNQALIGDSGSQTIYFTMNENHPWWRIYVQNDSSVNCNITLVDNDGTNMLVKSPWKLEGGKSVVLTNENAAKGKRYLTITHSNGAPLEGRVSIRVASSKEELA